MDFDSAPDTQSSMINSPVEAVVFVTSLTAGGAERMLCSVIENLHGELDVRAIICWRGTEDRRLKDRLQALCPIIELNNGGILGRAARFWRVAKLCSRYPRAVFLGWMYHGCLLASFFRIMTGAPGRVLWSIHSSGLVAAEKSLLPSLEFWGAGLMCRLSAAELIFCGKNSQYVHLTRWRWPSTVSSVLGNGINTNRFVPSGEIRRKIRSDLGINDNTLILGYAGRWHPDKDVETLCRALALLGGRVPGLAAIFCGRGLSTQNPGFREAIADISVSDVRIIGLGEIADLSQMIPAFDFLCLSSVREAFPLVLCEALSCGVPCIATNVGDCRDIVGKHGRIVGAGDPVRMSESIAQLSLELRSRRAAELKAGARAHAVANFDESTVSKRYLSLLVGGEGGDKCI